MKKFKNNITGVIYEVTNKDLLGQYENRTDLYTEIGKADNEPTIKDLKAKADEMGVKYTKNVTKAELVELISAVDENK